jgi:hypothetical protein
MHQVQTNFSPKYRSTRGPYQLQIAALWVHQVQQIGFGWLLHTAIHRWCYTDLFIITFSMWAFCLGDVFYCTNGSHVM